MKYLIFAPQKGQILSERSKYLERKKIAINFFGPQSIWTCNQPISDVALCGQSFRRLKMDVAQWFNQVHTHHQNQWSMSGCNIPVQKETGGAATMGSCQAKGSLTRFEKPVLTLRKIQKYSLRFLHVCFYCFARIWCLFWIRAAWRFSCELLIQTLKSLTYSLSFVTPVNVLADVVTTSLCSHCS